MGPMCVVLAQYMDCFIPLDTNIHALYNAVCWLHGKESLG